MITKLREKWALINKMRNLIPTEFLLETKSLSDPYSFSFTLNGGGRRTRWRGGGGG